MPKTNVTETLQEAVDSLRAGGQSTAFDSIWTGGIPTKAPSPLEEVMLSHDKLYVVLAVVLIIWIGIMLFIYRTDARIDKLERLVDEGISDQDTL